jgi:hypothetical protein
VGAIALGIGVNSMTFTIYNAAARAWGLPIGAENRSRRKRSACSYAISFTPVVSHFERSLQSQREA